MSDLNLVTWGAGEPLVLVHGSFGWGTESWAGQRPLAERHRLLLVDRRGFGHSPPAEREDFRSTPPTSPRSSATVPTWSATPTAGSGACRPPP